MLEIGTEPTPEIWDPIFGEQGWGKYPSEHIVRNTINLPRGPVLDMGSGPGSVAWFLAREGFQVSALDISPRAIGQLQERLYREGFMCDARVDDFTHGLPWEDGTFQAVVDNAAIYTAGYCNAKRAVAEAHRVLKPGGTFLSISFSTMTSPLIFQNRGYALLLGPDDVKDLYAIFPNRAIERASYTRNEAEVHLWIAICKKGEEHGRVPEEAVQNRQ